MFSAGIVHIVIPGFLVIAPSAHRRTAACCDPTSGGAGLAAILAIDLRRDLRATLVNELGYNRHGRRRFVADGGRAPLASGFSGWHVAFV
ncbi:MULTISPECIES: hypothetical protein [unclassified Shinella]|uniref:hypothetical protein n=1 Tax=unclassified Shinella TaxID=2643062 RepID=UPI00225D6357|nr:MULTISPECIES: hypothetical protein [unclassified Shinella]MCO5136694.1 hypothetical protein [Shinella sp.]MDC7253629.1 hypothetical protein [Shinella sp. YE25]CAI0336265.1 hypothetical protein SHINE37_40119 [Rhizobiaceae bacterium]CAK7254809.1 protein of unknown function [Shinella sp. WSC3-e]